MRLVLLSTGNGLIEFRLRNPMKFSLLQLLLMVEKLHKILYNDSSHIPCR
jgi:hypothetical protein